MKNKLSVLYTGLLAGMLLISGCGGGGADVKACYEKWRTCMKACSDQAKKADQEYRDCIQAARDKLDRAKQDCDTAFPGKGPDWADCLQKAMDTANAEEAACAEKRQQAMDEVEKCREACADEFKKCAGIN